MEALGAVVERESVRRWLRDATIYAAFIASWGFVAGVLTYFGAAVYEFVADRRVNRLRAAEEGAFVGGFIALTVVIFVRP